MVKHLTEHEAQQYALGELRAQEFTDHLSACEHCSNLVATYRSLLIAVKQVPPLMVYDDLETMVMQRLKIPVEKRPLLRLQHILIYTAVACALVAGCWLYINGLLAGSSSFIVTAAILVFFLCGMIQVMHMVISYSHKHAQLLNLAGHE